MSATYKGRAGIFPVHVFRCSGRNELSLLETTLWQTHGATQLPCCSPASPGVYKSPSGKRGDAKDGTHWGQGWISTPLPWELTEEAAPLLVMQKRQSCCGSSPGALHKAGPSPAPALTCCPPLRGLQQQWSSDRSQRPWWSFHQLGQLWLSPRGTMFPMTHSSGRGEIIGKVANVALSVREHTQAGTGQGLGAGRGCEGVSRLGM